MPESAVIKFVLQDETTPGRGAAVTPEMVGFPPPQPSQPMSWAGAVEALRWGGRNVYGGVAIPPPPPPPRALPAPQAAQPALGGLQQSIDQLTATIAQQHALPVGRAIPVPPPAPPPLPEQGPNLLQQFMAGAGGTALPSFMGGLVGGITGSPTLGGLTGTAAGGVQGALMALGPPGVAVAAALGGITIAGTAVVEVFKRLRDTADNLVQSVSDLSPHVARATAMADVRLLQDQLRRARGLGPELGTYVTARAEFRSEMNRLTDAIMKDLVPVLTEVVQAGAVVIRVVEKIEPVFGPIFWTTLRQVVALIPHGGRALALLIPLLRQQLEAAIEEEKRRRREEDIKFVEEIESFFTDPRVGTRGTLVRSLDREGGEIPAFWPQLGQGF